jgi:uncharacterized protein (TIGR03437 family)
LSGRGRIFAITILSGFASLPLALRGNSSGAEPGLTGAPGDRTCAACHTGTDVNAGGGTIKIVSETATYTPGAKQRIQVQLSDSSQRRWGFELSARVAGAPATQAGTLASVDANTAVQTQSGVQFVTHTLSGTRNGATGGVTFEVEWTPPATDVGDVVLYAAGNAANGNNSDSGDRIYTTSLTIAPAAAGVKPSIRSENGVVNGASFQTGIASRSWVTVVGTNLSQMTRLWNSEDIIDGKLPTALDGVSVTINGKPAYVQYVSPTQINVVAPEDTSTGLVAVRVTSNGQTSDAAIATLQTFAPAFFGVDGKYLAATHADNSLLGRRGLFANAPDATTPAKPGETIILYGSGFGPTDPKLEAGQPADKIATVTTPLTITIGGIAAAVSFAGLVPPFADLYQFNVQVPETVGDGDQPVVAQIGGMASVSTASCCFVTVQR